MTMRACLVSILVFFICSNARNGLSQSVEVRRNAQAVGEELVSQAIRYRQRITEGEFEFHSNHQFQNELLRETLYCVVIKGDKMRSHRWLQNIEMINCFGCYGDDFVSLTVVADRTNPDDLRPLLTIRSGDLVSRHAESELEPDPRLIGMLPNDYRSNARYRVQELLTSSEGNYRVSEGFVGIQACTLVEFKNDLGADVSCWLVPEKGNSFVQLEIKRDDNIYKVESVISFLEESKIWFPERVLFSHSVKGVLHSKEELTVKKVSLREVDLNEFTIRAMKAKPGTPVYWSIPNRFPPSDPPLIWDGSDIVSNRMSGEKSPNKWLKIVLFNTGLIGALVGGWLTWRSFRPQNQE